MTLSTLRSAAAGLLLAAAWPGVGAAAQGSPAQLVSLSGAVEHRRGGQPAWAAAAAGKELAEGDEVRTRTGAEAVLAFSDGAKMRLGPDSVFRLESRKPELLSVRLLSGVLDAWIRKGLGRRVDIRTRTAVASVRGTVLRAQSGPGGDMFFCWSGQLMISDRFGNQTRLDGGGSLHTSENGLQGSTVESLPRDSEPPSEPDSPDYPGQWAHARQDAGDENATGEPGDESPREDAPLPNVLQETTTKTMSQSAP